MNSSGPVVFGNAPLAIGDVVDLAARLGVPTPAMDAVIEIASVVLARDFRGEGKRTMSTLGLDAMSPEQLAAL